MSHLELYISSKEALKLLAADSEAKEEEKTETEDVTTLIQSYGIQIG